MLTSLRTALVTARARTVDVSPRGRKRLARSDTKPVPEKKKTHRWEWLRGRDR
jgi:hypothetical protein